MCNQKMCVLIYVHAAIMCNDIPDPTNGQIVFTDDKVAPFAFETEALYNCNPGYNLDAGVNPRVCESVDSSNVGDWSGTGLTCSPAVGKWRQYKWQ